MLKGCFIGIDQGSSSTKALVLGAGGEVIFRTKKALPPPVRQDLRVEHDARYIFNSVREALDEAANAAASSGMKALGVGLSCQRSSCLIWNEASGEPLSPVLSWRDARGRDFTQGIADHGDMIFKTTGLPLTPYYSASKFRWLKENVPAASQGATIFGTLSSFIAQQLTGRPRAVIDHTNAARTQLMNIRSLAWDADLPGLFGIKDIRLPEITPTASSFGDILAASETMPLLACIGDQQAAMLGLGVLEKGDGGINYGTGGFLMVNTGGDLVPAPGLMASVQYSFDNSRRYMIEGSVNAVGDALEWLRQRLGLFSEYAGLDDLCWKASTDTVVFIGLNGTGAPHWETDISSAIHGLTGDSTQADVVRGTVECIAFFMKDISEAMRSSGVEPLSFALAGGLSSLSYLVQIQADILGKDIIINDEQEVSALGAAMLAGMQQGAWSSSEIKDIAQKGETVNPGRNAGLEKRYKRWKELHRFSGMLDRK